MAKSNISGKAGQAKPKVINTKPVSEKPVKKVVAAKVDIKSKPESIKEFNIKTSSKNQVTMKTLPKKQTEKKVEAKKQIVTKSEVSKKAKTETIKQNKETTDSVKTKSAKQDDIKTAALKNESQKEINPVSKLKKSAIKGSTEEISAKEQEYITVEEKQTNSPEIEEKGDLSIERKLVALFGLQLVDTEINKIRIIRGELPLEVQDLEDEIEGLETRIEKFNVEIKEFETDIKEKKTAIKDHQAQIKKYESQQMNVRNNREYDSLTKEIEFQTLEIQLCEKKIKETAYGLDLKNKVIEETKQKLSERKEDLKQKKIELEEIVAETEKEEKKLIDKLQESQKNIEERLISAYQRIKKNARNGLAVVVVERDACGGCFNKIPPQRQLDIKVHKKIIVCEYCGRILIDKTIEEKVRNKN